MSKKGGEKMTQSENRDVKPGAAGRSAPYVPAATLSNFFDHVRWVSTPKKVDAGLLLDYGMPQGNIGALLSALKFFGLVQDDGTATPAFKMIQTGGDEFRANLEEIVKRAYADVFSRLDPSRDSREKIRNYFARNYSPAISNKATILFLDLCKEAGIPVAEETTPTLKHVGRSSSKQLTKRSITKTKHEIPTSQAEQKPSVATLTEDELQRMYVRRLIENITTPDTSGKDAEAIEADAKLFEAQLDRIERLLKVGKGEEKEESAEEELPF